MLKYLQINTFFILRIEIADKLDAHTYGESTRTQPLLDESIFTRSLSSSKI